MAGMKIVPVKVTQNGAVDLSDLSKKVSDLISWYKCNGNQFVLSARPSKMIFAVFRFMMIHIALTHCYKLESFYINFCCFLLCKICTSSLTIFAGK